MPDPADTGAPPVMGDPALRAAANGPADVILIDSPDPGSGRLFDWKLAEGAPGGVRLMLAGGLTPDNVAEAVLRGQPWGVDVSSGVERSPGRKDPLRVKAFIERARAAAPEQHLGPDELPYDWADEY